MDAEALKELFTQFDADKDGGITLDELELMLLKLGVAPLKDHKGRNAGSSE